jgi:hypothetical protein
MRRFALLPLLLPLAAVHAQATSIMGGYVSSTMAISSSTATLSPNSRGGFAAGIDFSAPVGENLRIAAEALYVQKGFSISGDNASGSLRSGYVEVPVLLRISMGERDTRFFVFGGPHIAFKVMCSVDVSGSSSSTSTDCNNTTTADDDNFKSVDYGVTFGAGIRMGSIGVQARYDLGLANVNNDDTSNTTVKNRALLLLASVYLK